MEEVKKVPDEETGGGRQNTMKILDKREEAWEEKKKSDGWNGYHVLFTETTQFLIIWEDMKKKLKIAYFATLAFLILFVVCLGGAGIWNFIESALLSAVVPIIYGLFCRDDIYLKVFDPARDQGALYLPEEMTWEEAVDVIRRGFATPEVEQITDTADTVVFHSKKYGAYQVQNTENGLKLSILSVPSKKEENKSRYYLFGNMIYSQIISLLYPEMLSAVQVEQEKKAVHGYLKQKKIINLVANIAVIVVIAAVASGGFNMDSIKSCGLSDSQMPSIFSADATLDEIFDTYFDDSKWDNYKEDGKKIVTYIADFVVVHLKCRAIGIQAKDSPGIRAGNTAFAITEPIFFGQIQCRYKPFHAIFNLSFMCSSTMEKSHSTKSLIIVENSSTKVRSSSSHRVYRKSRIFRCTRRWFQKRSSICFSVSSVIRALTMVLFIVISYAVVQVGFGKSASMLFRNSENSRTARLLTSFIRPPLCCCQHHLVSLVDHGIALCGTQK